MTTFICKKYWNYDKYGGIYNLTNLNEAKKFIDEQGFVVIKNIITEDENKYARELFSKDLTNICKDFNNRDVGSLDITEDILPGTPGGFRNGYGIAFGEYAQYCRSFPNVKNIFSHFQNCKKEDLCISWDNIFYNSANSYVYPHFWLHFDKMKYDINNNLIKGWGEHMLQSALYLTESNLYTPSFICIPKSHKEWNKFAKYYRSQGHFFRLQDTEEYRNLTVRIHIPRNGIIVWNSQLAHANSSALYKRDLAEPKRLGVFLCMCDKKKRDENAILNMLALYFKGVCSTHWPNLMLYHGNNSQNKKKILFI